MRLVRAVLSSWMACAALVAGMRVELGAEPPGCAGGCCCAPAESSCCAEDDGPVMTSACACGHETGSVCLDLSQLVTDLAPASEPRAIAEIDSWVPRMRALGEGRSPAPEPPPPRRSAA